MSLTAFISFLKPIQFTFFLNFGEMIKIHEIIHKIYQFDEDSQSLFTLSDGSLSNPDWIP
jgi:hypothetical protein